MSVLSLIFMEKVPCPIGSASESEEGAGPMLPLVVAAVVAQVPASALAKTALASKSMPEGPPCAMPCAASMKKFQEAHLYSSLR